MVQILVSPWNSSYAVQLKDGGHRISTGQESDCGLKEGKFRNQIGIFLIYRQMLNANSMTL
jgi:hypothetical protein